MKCFRALRNVHVEKQGCPRLTEEHLLLQTLTCGVCPRCDDWNVICVEHMFKFTSAILPTVELSLLRFLFSLFKELSGGFHGFLAPTSNMQQSLKTA